MCISGKLRALAKRLSATWHVHRVLCRRTAAPAQHGRATTTMMGWLRLRLVEMEVCLVSVVVKSLSDACFGRTGRGRAARRRRAQRGEAQHKRVAQRGVQMMCLGHVGVIPPVSGSDFDVQAAFLGRGVSHHQRRRESSSPMATARHRARSRCSGKTDHAGRCRARSRCGCRPTVVAFRPGGQRVELFQTVAGVELAGWQVMRVAALQGTQAGDPGLLPARRAAKSGSTLRMWQQRLRRSIEP